MQRIFIYFSLLIIILANSCDNSLEVDAPWKDISVIYCIINPDDSIHYVKLNKCFLGNGDNSAYAQISDSIYYNNATVKLITGEINDKGEFIEDYNSPVILLEKTTEIPKDSGLFTTNNIIYRTLGNSTFLNQKKDYKLLIEMPQKDNIEAYLSIIPIADLKIDKPNVIELSVIESDTLIYQWQSVPNATFYESKIEFIYAEIYNNVITIKTIKLKQISQMTRYDFGNETMSMSITAKQFHEYINSVIKSRPDYNPNAVRIAYKYIPFPNDLNHPRNKFPFKLYLNVCTEDLYDFIQYSNFYNDVMTVPPYSNIPNNIGIFSSRASKVFVKSVTDKTIHELSVGELTKDLNFMDVYATDSFWSNNEGY